MLREPDPRTPLPVARCDGCERERPVFEGPHRPNGEPTRLCFACLAMLTHWAMGEAERILANRREGTG